MTKETRMKAIEYLSLYLPHKLYVWDSVKEKPIVMNMGEGSSTNWVGIKSISRYHDDGNYVYKPLLFPPTMLFEEMEHKAERFIPMNHLEIFGYKHNAKYCYNLSGGVWSSFRGLRVWQAQLMLKWHFDVFNLIQEGKALDKSKLAS